MNPGFDRYLAQLDFLESFGLSGSKEYEDAAKGLRAQVNREFGGYRATATWKALQGEGVEGAARALEEARSVETCDEPILNYGR